MADRPRSSQRYERAQIAAALRARGRTWVEVATVFHRRYRVNMRAALRLAHGWSQRQAADEWNARWPDEPKTLKNFSYWEAWPSSTGHEPSLEVLGRLAELYECGVADLLEDLADYRHLDAAVAQPAPGSCGDIGPTSAAPHAEVDDTIGVAGNPARSFASSVGDDDEEEALELARRVAASDVGAETLTRLETVIDDIAVAYSATPPAELLRRVRLHLAYVARLIDSRKTLHEHRQLLNVGGWLSLLAATIHIDLGRHGAATARLRTAMDLARHTGHGEIQAWCLETEAWRQLTEGNYPQAVTLSQAAQHRAPRGSSAAMQATAQEGRAWARLGRHQETYAAIARVGELVSPLARPDRPEHHYRYDPDKYIAYTATTLAWVGDPAAETYAREVINRLRSAEHDGKWPRRIASANLDLALALLVTNRLDEAAGAAHEAITSGRVVPSNHWRALEVVRAVESRHLTGAKDLREAYEVMRRGA